MCLLYANKKFARILNKIFHPMDPKIDLHTYEQEKNSTARAATIKLNTLNMQQELNYTALSNLVQHE